MSDTMHLIETTRASLDRCQRDHDRAGAVGAILAAVEVGLSIEDLYGSVLRPFLASIGRGWQQGQTAVWEEHLIVGAVRAAVEALYPNVLERKAAAPALPMTVAFFCPPEETHDLGLRMLVDLFDLRGFRTVYVGAGTPVDEMVKCVQAEKAGVVCLSASTHFQKAALHNVITSLRQQLPGVRLVAGGPAFVHGAPGWEEYVVSDVDALLDGLVEQATGTGGASAGATSPAVGAAAPSQEQGHA